MWRNFAVRLWKEDGFPDFFEYNSYKFGALVAELFETTTGKKFPKAEITKTSDFLAEIGT